MPSMMSLPAVLSEKPALPLRPTSHERDGRQPADTPGRPHTGQHAPADPTTVEALRRVVETQIGPRLPGAIYQNKDGAFEVIALVRNPAQARELLKQRCAQWALVVKDVLRADSEPVAIGTAWTTSDYLVREARRVGGMR